jgi:hypothetical protein
MARTSKGSDSSVTFVERLCVGLSVTTTLCFLAMLLWRSRYGIDLTDESSYLVWISNPWIYKTSVSQFGYIYHPFYLIFGGSIAALRQASILVIFGFAWALCIVFFKTVFVSAEKSDRWCSFTGLVSSAALATSSLIILDSWLSTPSYNSLNLQALLVSAIGLLFAEKTFSRLSAVGWTLIGVGGWLALMAKPTTAAGLSICAAVYLFAACKMRYRLLALALAVSVLLLLLSAWAIDGSIVTFIDRVRGGARMLGLVEGGYNPGRILRWSNPRLYGGEVVILSCLSCTVFAAVFLAEARNAGFNRVGRALWLAFSLVSLAVISGLVIPDINFRRFQGSLILAVPFAAIGYASIRAAREGSFPVPRSSWALSFCFAAFPYIYALGTNNNYWETGSDAGIFWVLAGLVFLGGTMPAGNNAQRALLTLGLAAQLITVVLMSTGLERPYRQNQPLRLNNRIVEIGEGRSKLVLSQSYADYLQNIKGTAKQTGFRAGTPMIDLTGRSPGVLYHIGAESIGQAWMIGGYKGSDRKALERLRAVSCKKIAAAWLLTEPDGSRAVSSEILSYFGLRVPDDFEVVASVTTPLGGYLGGRNQLLLRPVRNPKDAEVQCEFQKP